ncbi:hypothetical protein HMPREF9371_1401 [Neisseria shayeganii 871]|uniref:Uncharacterized protein n=1 Tax=Neisseria shayeganii 871 TaxID=1032488 RepID=G4CIE1_9NEIS|nr:hypothetical protein HMPREF9371_1401 [Neisseria shayeganii 871]
MRCYALNGIHIWGFAKVSICKLARASPPAGGASQAVSAGQAAGKGFFPFPEAPAAAGRQQQAAAGGAVGLQAEPRQAAVLQVLPQRGEQAALPGFELAAIGVDVGALDGGGERVEIQGGVGRRQTADGGFGLPGGPAFGRGRGFAAAEGGPRAIAADEAGGAVAVVCRQAVPQPQAVDRRAAFGLALLVDGLAVQPHLDFGLPLQPLGLRGADCALGAVGLADDVQHAGRLPAGGFGQMQQPQIGAQRLEAPAVFGIQGVQAVAQGVGFCCADGQHAVVEYLHAVHAGLLPNRAGEGIGLRAQLGKVDLELAETEIGGRGGRGLETAEAQQFIEMGQLEWRQGVGVGPMQAGQIEGKHGGQGRWANARAGQTDGAVSGSPSNV